MTFGTRLTEARKRKGLTQQELGKGLGTDGKDVSKAVVYGWEKDQHHPRVDQLVLICDKLGVGSDYLLFGKVSAGELPHDVADLAARADRLPPKAREFVLDHLRSSVEYSEHETDAAAAPAVEPNDSSSRTKAA